jgi:hypothetical protein
MPVRDGVVEQTYTIHARPSTIFRFFADPARFALVGLPPWATTDAVERRKVLERCRDPEASSATHSRRCKAWTS